MAEKDRYRKIEVRVKLSLEENELLENKIAYCGLNKSDYFRRLVVDGAIIVYEKVDIKGLAFELNKIGNNINQIARSINERGGVYDRQNMDELIHEFQNMQQLIYEKVWGME